MFPLDLIGEPNLAVAQFVEMRLNLLLKFFNNRKMGEMIGLLRAMIGHIHLAGTASRSR
jgi:hypothetical protein